MKGRTGHTEIAAAFWGSHERDASKLADMAIDALTRAGFAIVPVKSTEQEPDHCYNAEYWEVTYRWQDRDLVVEDLDPDGVVEVGCLAQLPSRFIVPIRDEFDQVNWHWHKTRESAEDAEAATALRASQQTEPEKAE